MINTQNMKDQKVKISGSLIFWISKRFFDLFISFLLLFVLIPLIPIIGIINRFYNEGPIFYVQKRMGKDCMPFYVIKFRTMINIDIIERKHYEPLETDRITALGNVLRKFRLDELPQIINVLKGDMSLIGPRPDYYEHAVMFLEDDINYRYRHVIRPGISGLSQIRLGYAEGVYATRKKSKVDIFYIENANFFLDFKIFCSTIFTIFWRLGT